MLLMNKMMIQTVHKYKFIMLQTIYIVVFLYLKKEWSNFIAKNGVPLTYCKKHSKPNLVDCKRIKF